ncbi:MAG TPA: MCE family protein [Acidobacteria bacterium]|nr:MCE family protein [Acidobacteriota bacterium]
MASRSHEFTAEEIRAGFLVLASLVILAVFLVVLSGWRPKDRTAHRFMATFTNVGGLDVAADVRFGGVRVGRVTAIEPDPSDRARIRVAVEVRGDTPVNAASVATIEQVSLTAEKHLEISTGTADAPLLSDGATLRSRTTGGGLIEMPELDGVVTRLTTLLDRLNALVGPVPSGQGAAAGDLRTLFASLKTALDEGAGVAHRVNGILDGNDEGIHLVVDRLAAMEATGQRLLEQLENVLSESGPALQRSTANLERLTEQMSSHMEELGAALQSVQEAGANGADLLEDQRPAIEEILFNLRVMTRHLADLSRELADKPNALVVGAGKPRAVKGESP